MAALQKGYFKKLAKLFETVLGSTENGSGGVKKCSTNDSAEKDESKMDVDSDMEAVAALSSSKGNQKENSICVEENGSSCREKHTNTSQNGNHTSDGVTASNKKSPCMKQMNKDPRDSGGEGVSEEPACASASGMFSKKVRYCPHFLTFIYQVIRVSISHHLL